MGWGCRRSWLLSRTCWRGHAAAVAIARVPALTHAFPSRFWGLLAEYLLTHSVCTLPLATSFSLGMGTSRFLDGKVGVG